jgi:hypothetical protein
MNLSWIFWYFLILLGLNVVMMAYHFFFDPIQLAKDIPRMNALVLALWIVVWTLGE